MSLATLLSETVGLWRNRPAATVVLAQSDFPDVSQAPPDTRRLIRDRRYCRVLAGSDQMEFDATSRAFAWKALEHEMALVPGGEVTLISDTAMTTRDGFELAADYEELVNVESFYLDRHCVTNAEFLKFVQAGGYADAQYWPEHVLPNLLQFVDQTGSAGPKHWVDGQPPEGKLDHPVVGVCWYEANAYATWVGKRLPSTEQWQRSGTWPKGHGGNGAETRYPWGNAFDPHKANVWASGVADTVPVDQFACGGTPNGVKQLIGNVWEWVDTQFLPTAEEYDYDELSIELNVGDSLVIYSDGFPDAENAAGEERLGSQPIIEALQEFEGTATQTIENLVSKVDDFITGGSQFDDMCMVCLKRSSE